MSGTRRELHWENLDESVAECERLLDHGYSRVGQWSLGQICRHLRVTQDASIDGYPKWMSIAWPIRPVLRRLLLPRLLRGDSPAGIKAPAVFVPPNGLSDAEEFTEYAASVNRFQNYQGQLYPHPGFGRFNHSLFERFHAAHAAHHLGFLIPNSKQAPDESTNRPS